MTLDNLTIFNTCDGTQAELTVQLPVNLIQTIESISNEYEVPPEKIVESAIYFWLLKGKI